MPVTRIVVDRDTAGPHGLFWLRQAQIRARRCEAGQTMRGGIGIGFVDACGPPVRAAEGVDSSLGLLLVERFDDWSNRNGLIVAVKQIKVDIVGLEPFEAFGEVRRDHGWRDTWSAVADWVTALINDHNLIAIAVARDPTAKS